MNHKTWLIVLALVIPTLGHAGWDPADNPRLQREAPKTIAAFRATDPSLNRFFESAVGWAVFPTVGKGGFVLGGAYGKGVVYSSGSVVGFTELKQISVGLQVGGQTYSELIFFRDQAALERFKSEKLEFDAQVSAIAIDKGAAASADYHAGVAVFTKPKSGLMAEASVGGQSFSYVPR